MRAAGRRPRRLAILGGVVLAAVCVVTLALGPHAAALTREVRGLIDRSAPAVAVSGVRDGSWVAADATVTLTASDGTAGSGVASITYTLDGVSHTVADSSVRVALGAKDATRTLIYHATDEAGNAGDDERLTLHVDTEGPSTVARSATAAKGAKLTLRYRVDDASSPTATDVVITVKNGDGSVVKRLEVGRVSTGTWHTAAWTPSGTGCYTWSVAAQDLAGNAQTSAVKARCASAWPAWQVIGHSVENRSIKVARFGSGGRRLLIIGGVHPLEAGTSVAGQFIAYLTKHPEAVRDGCRIDVIECLNPDGLADGTRGNARDVDLNRNFPCSDWRRVLSADDVSGQCGLSGGSSAGSEPETKALISYLDQDFSVVLTLHSDAGVLDCHGPGAAKIARRMSKLCGLPVGHLSYESVMTGTLEQYVAQSRHIPAIMVELKSSAELTCGLREALLNASLGR